VFACSCAYITDDDFLKNSNNDLHNTFGEGVTNSTLLSSRFKASAETNLNSKIASADESDMYILREENYSITDEQDNKRIAIYFPQFEHSKRNTMLFKVNGCIKAVAMEVLQEFSSFDNLDIEVTYSVECNSAHFFSVKFIVQSFHVVQAYPLIRCKTIVIDMNTGEKLALNDIVIINQEFVDIFFERFENIRQYDNHCELREKSIEAYVKEWTTFDALLTCDEKTNVDYCSYLTDEYLVICIHVPFQIGSYALYGARLEDIQMFLTHTVNTDVA